MRLEELYREELNSILNSEISDRRLEAARVTRVELSRDGSRARVWYTPGSSPELSRSAEADHQSAFEHARGFLRARLAEALPLERTPVLQFRWDPVADPGALLLPDETPEPTDEASTQTLLPVPGKQHVLDD